MSAAASDGNARDAHVVEDICAYLTAKPAKSFFLFAGAGSGKTRTLVEVLRRLTGVVSHVAGGQLGRKLRARGQSIRVITYTRNAAAVIEGRLGANDLTKISTIHSFCWDLIEGLDEDIRGVLVGQTKGKIAELEEKEKEKKKKKRGKPLAAGDVSKLDKHRRKLDMLSQAKSFKYSPDTDRPEKGALTHADVLFATSELLKSHLLLGNVLIASHPILLIDESQDTMKDMLDALLLVTERSAGRSTLGLLGDHRQRIYADGHKDLPTEIPASWERPALQMNHRSQERIVRLINAIWAAEIDGRTQPSSGVVQHARTEKSGGHVRIFVGSTSTSPAGKVREERACAQEMATASDHAGWTEPDSGYQILALEHRLAALRGGFPKVFDALVLLDKDAAKPQGSGDNKGPTVARALWEQVTALTSCVRQDGAIDDFAVVDVLNAWNRLENLPEEEGQRIARLQALQQAVQQTIDASRVVDATVRYVIESVVEHDLLDFHPQLKEAFLDSLERPTDPEPRANEAEDDRRGRGWHDLFDAPWKEVELYHRYLRGEANVATHQIVKGSEFEHVMVIMDDKQAGGFLFSYDKVFGAQPLTNADHANANKETGIDRTLRLLYVTSSRAKESLALVLWSRDPNTALARIRASGWFEEAEVRPIPSAS